MKKNGFQQWSKEIKHFGQSKEFIVRKDIYRKILLWSILGIFISPFLRLYDNITRREDDGKMDKHILKRNMRKKINENKKEEDYQIKAQNTHCL